jgi:uncharacterized protein (AIM24 family)
MFLRVVYADLGAMMFMAPDVQTTVRTGKCSRLCTGEPLCITVYTNKGNQDAYVALTPKFPAKVVPIDLTSVGNHFIAKTHAWLSSIGDVSVTADFDCCSFASCCGGLGTIRQSAK